MKKEEQFYSRLSEDVSERLGRYGVSEGAVSNLLSDEHLRGEVDFLREHRVPERVIYRVVERGIADALNSRQKPSITPKLVAFTIYEQMERDDRYKAMADEFVREGYLTEGEIRKFRALMERGLREQRKVTREASRSLEGILKKAAVYLPFAISTVFLLKSLFLGGITGAFIGGTGNVGVTYGVVFFLLGLALYYFLYN